LSNNETLTIEAVGQTHPGMVRDSNQDSLSIIAELGIYLVADGMGGRAGGEVASQLAVKTIGQEVEKSYPTFLTQSIPYKRSALCKIINHACLKIYERSLELPQYRGMGTTTTFLWIPPESYAGIRAEAPATAIVAHVGDSRCYLLRHGFLYQVTDDHSLVNEQVKAGLLKRNDPMAAQIRNVITRCVGYQEEEEVDTFPIDVFNDDVFLLCSDGLTNKIRDTELSEHMAKDDLNRSASDLIRLANARGGEDNITVLMVRVKKNTK
jgi:PPM family protein phosphatase